MLNAMQIKGLLGLGLTAVLALLAVLAGVAAGEVDGRWLQVGCLLVILIGALVQWLLLRTAKVAMLKLNQLAAQLATDGVAKAGNDQLLSIADAFAATQQQLKSAAVNAKTAAALKSTLDNSSVNIMMADNDGIIRYMNNATDALMRRSEANMRKILPQFRADQLINSNFDLFHKNPSHQRNLLSHLRGTHVTQISVGDMTFRLSASPIHNGQGERIGAVLEWIDRTEEVAAEQDIGKVVAAAAAGDFSLRVQADNKQGFYKQAAEGINQIVDTSDKALNDSLRVLSGLEQGNLTLSIRNDYQGAFDGLKQSLNNTILGNINV